jgi:hypothetical protein
MATVAGLVAWISPYAPLGLVPVGDRCLVGLFG